MTTQDEDHKEVEDPAGELTREEYLAALESMDSAVCEAVAVGQAQAVRMASPCVGFAMRWLRHLRLCAPVFAWCGDHARGSTV
ncbi:hypothetical protein [Luteimonas suaedae]|uniref:hypothetical protein n=1 Tax=Luteimonas suaedae TaxID=2605430 RepID=UPI0011ECB0A5|nr:hypothetical protein [Luteimonas suaedae]